MPHDWLGHPLGEFADGRGQIRPILAEVCCSHREALVRTNLMPFQGHVRNSLNDVTYRFLRDRRGDAGTPASHQADQDRRVAGIRHKLHPMRRPCDEPVQRTYTLRCAPDVRWPQQAADHYGPVLGQALVKPLDLRHGPEAKEIFAVDVDANAPPWMIK